AQGQTFAERIIAAHQAGIAARQAEQDRQFAIEKHALELKNMQFAQKAAQRQEELQNYQMMQGLKTAPEITTSAPQAQNMPIPTSLDESTWSAPVAAPQPATQRTLPLPPTTITSVYGAPIQLPTVSAQQAQIAERNANLQKIQDAADL